jgi:hypothetical protein
MSRCLYRLSTQKASSRDEYHSQCGEVDVVLWESTVLCIFLVLSSPYFSYAIGENASRLPFSLSDISRVSRPS